MISTPAQHIVLQSIAATWMVLAAGHWCEAQSADLAKVNTALGAATEGQREVLAELTRILQQEKVMLSDGAVRIALEALLNDEEKQVEGIRDLGRKTLGRSAEELTAAEKTQRDELAENQGVYAGRYIRLERGIEAKAAAQPDSVFASLLITAEETSLRQNFGEAAQLVRDNQIARALEVTNKIVAALRQMVTAVSGEPPLGEQKNGSEQKGVSLPGLWIKAPDQRLAEFKWTGAEADTLGTIMRGVKRLEDLARRQREVATKAQARAASDTTADDLAREEWEIRFLALEVATELSVLDPQLDQLLRKATDDIMQAIPAMEKGPLADAVEPATQAAELLEAAALRLKATWKALLERIKLYTQQAKLLVGGGMGIPHGMHKDALERIKAQAFMMLRATGALTEAMQREADLMDRTDNTDTDANLPSLKPEQDTLVKFIADEVVPFNVDRGQLPAHMQAGSSASTASAADLLKDATDRMTRAAAALADKQRPEALKREQQSIELMEDALRVMVDILQRLLGQKAPPALAPPGSGTGGTAMDPASGVRQIKGWLFELPSQQQERVRQALRGAFPQRYDRAIKLYYQAIAVRESSFEKQ